MEDLIRRSDAIKAIQECFQVLARQRVQAVKMIEAIPSADNEVISKLKTAIENEEICKNCPTAERISGKNLLGAMALGFSYGMKADKPQGEWIETLDGNEWYWHCSNCKKQWYEEDLLMGSDEFPHFCPNCGVMMKGADDE